MLAELGLIKVLSCLSLVMFMLPQGKILFYLFNPPEIVVVTSIFVHYLLLHSK